MILPFVRDLFLGLEQSHPFHALLAAVAPERGRARTGGLTETARALYMALLAHAAGRSVLVLAADNRAVESLLDLLRTFHEYASPAAPPPVLLPAHDLLPGDGLSPHPDISEKRAIALWKMARGQAGIVVAPLAAAAMRLEPPAFYANLALTVRRGDSLQTEMLATHLQSVG